MNHYLSSSNVKIYGSQVGSLSIRVAESGFVALYSHLSQTQLLENPIYQEEHKKKISKHYFVEEIIYELEVENKESFSDEEKHHIEWQSL